MGIVSVGRSLVIRQVLLGALVLALGGYGWVALSNIEGEAAHIPGDAGAHLAGSIAAFRWTLTIYTALGAALMAGVAVVVIRMTVGRPIAILAHAAEQVAAGGIDAMIEGQTRSDEIGRIAKALVSLRDAGTARAPPPPPPLRRTRAKRPSIA